MQVRKQISFIFLVILFGGCHQPQLSSELNFNEILNSKIILTIHKQILPGKSRNTFNKRSQYFRDSKTRNIKWRGFIVSGR